MKNIVRLRFTYKICWVKVPRHGPVFYRLEGVLINLNAAVSPILGGVKRRLKRVLTLSVLGNAGLSDRVRTRELDADKLFDRQWYLMRNPDVAAAHVDPLEHYLYYGWKELRSPCALFDARFYAAQKPELASKRTNPLEHYLREGGFEGLDPNFYFDSDWYLDQYPAVRAAGVNPLLHYVLEGEHAGNWPGPLFDPVAYTRENPELGKSPRGALAHLLAHHPPGIAMAGEHFRTANTLRHRMKSIMPAAESVPCILELHVESIENFLARPDSSENGNTVFASRRFTGEGVTDSVAFPKTPLIARITDALAVAGTRYVVASPNVIIHDEESHYFDNTDVSIKLQTARRLPPQRMTLRCHMRHVAPIASGINLMHESSNNYFHFIAETLPRMILAEEAGVPHSVPFLFEDDLHSSMLALINLANTSHRPVLFLERGVLYDVRDMFLPSNVSCILDAYFGGPASRQSILDVARIRAAVQHCEVSYPPTERSVGRKIFVSRNSKMRVLRNQQQLEMRLAEMGFEILRIEDLSVETQICIFRQATVVVAPTGAQVTNIVWCSPGTQVIVLGSGHPNHQLYLWELLGRVSKSEVQVVEGRRAFALEGKYAVHDDFYIDVEAVVSKITTIDKVANLNLK